MTTQTLLDFDLSESSDDSDFRIEDHDDESDDFSLNSNDDRSGKDIDDSDDESEDDDIDNSDNAFTNFQNNLNSNDKTHSNNVSILLLLFCCFSLFKLHISPFINILLIFNDRLAHIFVAKVMKMYQQQKYWKHQ